MQITGDGENRVFLQDPFGREQNVCFWTPKGIRCDHGTASLSANRRVGFKLAFHESGETTIG